jgi:3'(2'), 5'-bisphosphate nucleotidase
LLHQPASFGAASSVVPNAQALGAARPAANDPHARRQGTVAAVSRSHFDAATEAFLARLGPVTRNAVGSAIKFCQIAEGAADVYPRLATTCEWDVAAGHALVVAAGGVVMTPQGSALAYGRAAENFRVPAFIVWGDPSKAASVKS